MNKKDLLERDICTKYVTPALTAAGWDLGSQIPEKFYLTRSQAIPRVLGVHRGEARQ